MGFQVATRGHSLLCEPVDLRHAYFVVVVFERVRFGVFVGYSCVRGACVQLSRRGLRGGIASTGD